MEGGFVTVFDFIPPGPGIEGDGGGSFTNAFYVARGCSTETLEWSEKEWIYGRCRTSITNAGFMPSDTTFKRIMHHTTERHAKRVYDIVTLTLPNQTNCFYFDVTRYRYFWAKDH